MSDLCKKEESAEAEANGAWTESKTRIVDGWTEAKAEIGAANAEFKASMKPVNEQFRKGMSAAWAQYKEEYSKTAMGGLLRYLRDKATL